MSKDQFATNFIVIGIIVIIFGICLIPNMTTPIMGAVVGGIIGNGITMLWIPIHYFTKKKRITK